MNTVRISIEQMCITGVSLVQRIHSEVWISVNLHHELNIYREKVINTEHDCRVTLFLKEGVSLSERM